MKSLFLLALLLLISFQVSAQKKLLFYYSDFNKDGRSDVIHLKSDRYQEELIDNNFDGLVDHWIMSDQKKRMEFSRYFDGHFLNLLINNREQKGISTLSFVLSKDKKRYQLVGAQFMPHQKLNRSQDSSGIQDCSIDGADVVSCTLIELLNDVGEGKEANPVYHMSNDKADLLSQAVLNPCNSELSAYKGISPILNHLNLGIHNFYEQLDSSCYNSSGESIVDAEKTFKNNQLKTGLDQVIRTASMAQDPMGTVGDHRYLQCIRNHRLIGLAAKMEVNMFSPVPETKIFCSIAPPQLSSSGGQAHFVTGTYDTLTWEINLNLFTPTDSIQEQAEQFAKSYFHELLHDSGVMDEKLTTDITECCSAEYDGNSSHCKSLYVYSLNRLKKDILLNALKNNPNLSELVGVYSQMAIEIGSDSTDEMVLEYLTNMMNVKVEKGCLISQEIPVLLTW